MLQAGQRVGRMIGSLGQRVRQVADRTREEVTGDESDKKALARRFARELWVEGNLKVADELCTSDFVRHSPVGEFRGPEGMKQAVSQVRDAVSDLTSDFVDQIAEGNEVATRWITRGRVQGKPVEVDGITINRIVDGKIAEDWSAYDPETMGMHS
jgi:predicted SnoaL-like aldol condensation-catalyzing enzyme